MGAQRELKESLEKWNQGWIESELIQYGCKWIFQPPIASSACMSCEWKRLVLSVKTALKTILGGHMVTDVNGRVLTANSDNPSDFEPITPARFLCEL